MGESSEAVCVGLDWNTFFWDSISLTRSRYRRNILLALYHSELLEDSDAQVVRQSLNLHDDGSDTPPSSSTYHKILMVLILPCLIAYTCSRLYSAEDLWQYQTAAILHEKSLRLIQETELVARGFTLVSKQQSVWRFEGSSQHRQCPDLRRFLFHVARDTMLLIRSSTTTLLDLYLFISVDHLLANYMARLPLAEYGPCITLDMSSELESLTDGFSVAALKVRILQLCSLHVSECIVCLAELIPSLQHNPESAESSGFLWILDTWKRMWQARMRS
ncbi:hypothetical protein ScPMuIL_004014 [Solemya velum]